ncbi:MAG: xanthine dehydrogenase family protein [Candidatus Rokubacteria bacterium]|nr:xanthine dehydrogenase family protein [Candidatus Rokubacteria bacterium]MBI3827065.1 xanthine dehydrogenase family protein [Candidatus Rokubacteria bacterium]
MIGARVPRVEDARLLAGRGRFVGDIVLPRMAHVAFARSVHAHARIRAIDRTAALSAPGVIDVATASDLAVPPLVAASKMKGYRPTGWPVLASGKVRWAGEAVAAVVADSRYAAEDAAEAVGVDYEPLPVAADPAAAMLAGAPLVHEEAESNVLVTRTFSQGDAAAALQQAVTVVRERFTFHRHAGIAMENRACLAEFSPDAGLTLWSATQIPGIARDCLADLLGLPASRVRVIAPDVGGGFGIKTVLYPEEVVVAALARRLGRPVKWTGDRREDLQSSTQSWDEVIDAALGFDAAGRVVALTARVVGDLGAYSIYPWTAAIEVLQVVGFLPGPYRVPHYLAEAVGVATNKTPMGPYRGVGRPVSTFVMESLMDRAARTLDTDPIDLRLRNVIRPEDFPYRSPSGLVWDSGCFTESLEQVRALAGYDALRADQRAASNGRVRRGIGVATYVELTGVGSAIPVAPGADVATGTEGITLRVEPGGAITLLSSLAGFGQGIETTLAQVVASELGVAVEQVVVLHGDTGRSPHGTGAYASRSAVLGGGAAILASRAVREKALAIAAHLLEAAPADLTLEDGLISVRGTPDRRVSLAEVARIAYAGGRRIPRDIEPGLEATRFYDPFFGTASNATHLAVVDVDTETCAVSVAKYVVVEDCGRVINPLIVEGQTVGGVAQGVGAALLEEVVHAEDGQLLTGSLMDYLVPTAMEIPAIEVRHLDRPSPTTLGGFKGVGEGGTIGAPAAIANAVADALAPLGIGVAELPITPNRIFRLLSHRKG